MKFLISLVFVCLGFVWSSFAATSLDTAIREAQAEPTQPAALQGKDNSPIRHLTKPSQSPLSVAGGLDFAAGTLMQSEVRKYELKISNPSDQAVKISSINGNCPCISIKNFDSPLVIPAGQSWTMLFQIDADLIEGEDFSRKIFIGLEGYERMVIQLNGKIDYILAITPAKKLSFGHLRDPDEAWEVTASVTGIGKIADSLVLDTRATDEYVNLEVSEIAPNQFKITVTPKAVLPYADNFTYKLQIPVLKPENIPPVILWLRGSVATTLYFAPREIIVSSADFPNAVSTTKTIGCGIRNARLMEQQIREEKNQSIVQRVQQMKAVDWDKLMQHLECELPAGVTVKKSRLDYGLQLELIIAKDAFAKQQELEVKLHRGGRYFPPIKLRYQENKPQ